MWNEFTILLFIIPGVKVPGFVSGPLVTNAGMVSNQWIHISDWFPTIVRLAGGSVTNLTLDGYDQWDAILGHGKSPRKVSTLRIFLSYHILYQDTSYSCLPYLAEMAVAA